MTTATRVALTIKWRFFDRLCPYGLAACWRMSRDAR